MTPDSLDLDAIAARLDSEERDRRGVDFMDDAIDLIAEVERLRAEVARLRSVGEDDIATWAEYVTGKKWAPVEAGPNG